MKQRAFTTAILLQILLAFAACAPGRFQTIDLYVRQKNWPKAQDELEAVLRRNPNDGTARLMLAEIYAEQDSIARMVDVLNALYSDSPGQRKNIEYLKQKYWIANFERGQQGLNEDHYKIAARYFKNAVLIDSLNFDSRQKYADALYLSGNTEQAKHHYLILLQQSPDDLIIKNNLAEVYFAERDYRKTVRLCNEILAVEKNDFNALMRRAYAYDALGKTEQAEREFEYLSRMNPSAQLLIDFGLLYFRKGSYGKAIERFTEAIPYASDYHLLYRYLGEATWRIRDFESMAYWYEKVVETFPTDIIGWKNLAVAYEALGEQELLVYARQHIKDITSTN